MQYQSRTGPIVNDAATFSQEMVQGVSGSLLRGAPSQRHTVQLLDIPVVTSSSEMFAGIQGEWYPAPRIVLGPRIAQPLSQPTHTAASFSVEMSAGCQPVSPRLFVGKRFDQLQVPSVADYSVEMSGYHPDMPRLFIGPRIPQPLAQTSHQAASFSIEMATGNHPDTSRAFLGPRIPQPLGQSEHIAAPVSNDMIAGYQPSVIARFLAARFQQLQVPSVQDFSVEMAIGYHPDNPRLFTTPRIPQPLAQTTHQAASFSIEMAAGSQPQRARAFTAPRFDQLQVPLVVDFSVEMAAGYHPDTPRPMQRQRVGLPELPQVVSFSVEMAIGAHPDKPRVFLAPRLAQPLSQVEHVPAPFSPEMAAGSAPSIHRVLRGIRIGLPITQAFIDALLKLDVALAEQLVTALSLSESVVTDVETSEALVSGLDLSEDTRD